MEGHLHQPVAHRPVEAERRIGVDDGHQRRLAERGRHAVDAADEADDLERVLDRPGAEAQALPGLVELDREGPVHVQVARLDREVVRLERAAALLVDDVERPDHPDVVDEVGEVAGAPAAIEVADEGRARRPPRRRGSSRRRRCRARGSGRGARTWRARVGDQRLDLVGIEPDTAVRPIDGRAGAGERVEGPVAEHLDADLGQDPERGAVDRLDVVGRQDLDRPERVGQAPPRELGEPGRGAARPAARAVVRAGGSVCSGLVRWLMLRPDATATGRPAAPTVRRGAAATRGSSLATRAISHACLRRPGVQCKVGAPVAVALVQRIGSRETSMKLKILAIVALAVVGVGAAFVAARRAPGQRLHDDPAT